MAYIKSWADALANLLIEQGGFPAREMWLLRQLNVRQPSSEKPMGAFLYSHHNFGIIHLTDWAFDIQLVRPATWQKH
jgi:hypothetical protein